MMMLDDLQLLLQAGLLCVGGYYGSNIISFLCRKSPPIEWKQIGIKNNTDEVPILLDTHEIPTGIEYVYRLPIGISIKDIIAKQDKLESALRTKLEITKTRDYLCLIRTITSSYDNCYKIDLNNKLLDGMRFRIGRRLDGSDMILDLTGSECHTLVCGSTGSGKSVCLNILVSQLILKGVELYIVDFKRVEYTLYADYYNLKSLDYTESQCESTLKKLVELMNKRYEILSEAKHKNYTDYNKTYSSSPLRPVVLLIDEFSVIDPKSQSYKYLFDLLARARACNIIVIIATQRPDAKVITGSLKCNIKNTIVFKTENEVDSEIALSKKGDYRAFQIQETGVGLLKSKGKVVEFKGYYLSDEEILSQLKNALNKKKPIQPTKKVTPKTSPKTPSGTITVVSETANIKQIDLL